MIRCTLMKLTARFPFQASAHKQEEEEEEEGEESEMCAARDNDGRNRGRAAAELLGGTVGGVLQVSNLKL